MPPSETPATYGPVGENANVPPPPAPPAPTAPKKAKIPLWAFITGAVLLVLVVGVALLGGNNSGSSDLGPTPTPTATASATSSRVLSSIATQSAFLKFETDLDALTRGIQNTQIQNQQLLPPRLELPLGF